MPIQDIVAAENRIRTNETAEMLMSEIAALIKLRQKGTTMVSILPKGVFRCVLEYQITKVLISRYSAPYVRLNNRKQNIHFPALDKLSYDNHLLAVNALSSDQCEYQFTLADGANCGSKGSGNNWMSVYNS